jgi:LPS-assembly protein
LLLSLSRDSLGFIFNALIFRMFGRLIAISLLLLFTAICRAQQDITELPKFGEFPVEITAGETKFEGGVAIAQNHVVIHYGDVAIYAEYAEYNPDTHDVLLKVHVRIYRGDYAFVCDRAVYNLETKKLDAADFGGAKTPFEFTGENLSSIQENEYKVYNGSLTTSDSSKPDYHLKSKGMRIYPDDRVIFTNATLYVGTTPVFWFPYLYQSLNDEFSILPSVGYNNTYNAFLFTLIKFPVNDYTDATLHLNYSTLRGPSIGLDLKYSFGDNDENYGSLKTFFINDQEPNLNETSLGRPPISPGRYRVTYESRTFLTSDISAVVEVNKLSDAFLLQDFYPYEFETNPQPDNFVEVIKKGEAYTLSGFVRYQVNPFFQTTERLPEFSWEVARTPLFNSPIFYEATTSAGYLREAFPSIATTVIAPGLPASPNPNYAAFRFDTFHQLTYPKTYFGWLSVVPRIGVRGTYYEPTGHFTQADSLFNNTFPAEGTVQSQGARTRFVFNAGVEASFKLSRAYEGVQIRWLGLDGLRHVIQPYTNFSWVSNPTLKPNDILPFDRFIPSSQIPPIDFPQFVATDSIDHWTIWRLGLRNRLQTRRDNQTSNWLEVDNYFDINFKNPFSQTGHYSDFVNNVRFSPVPWLSLVVNSQLPVFSKRQFWEINTYLSWTVTPNLDISLGDLYLDHNPNFANSHQIYLQTYYRINDNWGFSIYENYEATIGRFQEQRYIIHRDLSSWVASLGLITRDNGGGKQDVGVQLILTLKDLPRFGLPVDLNPSSGL